MTGTYLKDLDENINYSEYLIENLDKGIVYANYVAEKSNSTFGSALINNGAGSLSWAGISGSSGYSGISAPTSVYYSASDIDTIDFDSTVTLSDNSESAYYSASDLLKN